MKQKSPAITDHNSGKIWVAVGGAAFTTLYFNSRIQDPFNTPKFWIITIMAGWLIGHLAQNIGNLIKVQKFKISLVLVFAFISSTIISFFNTKPLYIGLFGENMRRNGLLTYVSLAILFITVVCYFSFKYTNRLNLVAIFVGQVLAIYGLFQMSGLDFISWNNPYNAVISTVGNPNFAAAIMAIIATINFGSFMNGSINSYIRVLHLVTTVLLVTAIIGSDAKQGLLSLFLGTGFILIVYLYSRKKFLGYLSAFMAVVVGIFMILGMLQKGPLTELLYKNSVSVRGYYWDAGIKMFLDNFWFGVGIDRYGSYFKEYREAGYPLNYGWDLTSTNAHNLPIQFFSTGGIFLGITYLLITFYVIYRAYIGIKKFRDSKQLLLATYTGGWIAYQAQSFVSIDSIGISVWGWLLAAVIISLSMADSNEASIQNVKVKSRKVDIRLMQPIVSGLLSILSIVIAVNMYKGESFMLQSRVVNNPQDSNSRNVILEKTQGVFESPLVHPSYIFDAAYFLYGYGFAEKSTEIFQQILEEDPRNLDALNTLAEISERNNQIIKAIEYREQILKLDPWNARNILQLGREYKFVKDFKKMELMRDKILAFASAKSEAQLALTELVR